MTVNIDAFRKSVVCDLAVLSRLFCSEPDRPLLEWLRVSRYPQGVALSFFTERTKLSVKALSSAVGQLPLLGAAEGREALVKDYAGIFASGSLYALATESHWNGPQSLETVESWYRRHNFKIEDRLCRPSDSLPFQLGFLAHLLDDSESDPDRLLEIGRRFLRDHLLSWVPGFSLEMAMRCRTDFYRSLALFLETYLVTLEMAFQQADSDILSVPA
jgi:TorA maturation chaperone TorD